MPSRTNPVDHPVHDLIRDRWSPYAFEPRTIDPADLKWFRDLATDPADVKFLGRAPTISSNPADLKFQN